MALMRAATVPYTRRRRKYASDPEWRAKESARCARANRNTRLMRKHGITADAYDAAMASQNGACACCHKKLGRVVRVDKRPKTGAVAGLLCAPCSKEVATLRHVRAHAGAFEAHFKEWGMTVQLGRFYEIMALCGWTPGQDGAGGRQA